MSVPYIPNDGMYGAPGLHDLVGGPHFPSFGKCGCSGVHVMEGKTNGIIFCVRSAYALMAMPNTALAPSSIASDNVGCAWMVFASSSAGCPTQSIVWIEWDLGVWIPRFLILPRPPEI